MLPIRNFQLFSWDFAALHVVTTYVLLISNMAEAFLDILIFYQCLLRTPKRDKKWVLPRKGLSQGDLTLRQQFHFV